MADGAHGEQGTLWRALVGDGRPLLLAGAGSLAFSGGFAIFLGATRQFLPHDQAFLGVDAAELCAVASCRVVDFMVHDRVAWGGTLLAVAVMLTWLVLFPLAAGRRWAWNLLVAASLTGFVGFLAYLGYGYLDTWHGVGTLLLLPVFLEGIRRTRALVLADGAPLRAVPTWRRDGGPRLARELVLLVGAGLVVAGLVILTIGTSVVFVPQDLAFMGLDVAGVRAVDERLIPLIAHDRAGFGAGVLTGGLLLGGAAWFAERQQALWQAIGLGGGLAFGAALGVHVAVGYTDLVHLAPAVAATLLLAVAVGLGRREGRRPSVHHRPHASMPEP